MKKLKVNPKTLYIALAIVVVALLILVWLLNRSGLKVNVDPKNAIVTIDNIPIVVRNNGFASTTLSPGNHILKVEADGYISQIIELNLKRARTIDKEVSLQKTPKAYSISDTTTDAKNVQFISEGDDFNTVFYYADNASALYKAKFTVNGVPRDPVNNVRADTNEFVDEYEIPEGITNFEIEVQLNHSEFGWF